MARLPPNVAETPMSKKLTAVLGKPTQGKVRDSYDKTIDKYKEIQVLLSGHRLIDFWQNRMGLRQMPEELKSIFA